MADHHVTRFRPEDLGTPENYEGHTAGFSRVAHVDGTEGSVHTGFATCVLDPDGSVDSHVHSYEESFFILAGELELQVDGRAVRLRDGDCGLIPVGAGHSLRTGSTGCRWIEMCAPQPRALSRESDTFWLGDEPTVEAVELDVRDPMNRTYYRLAEGQMDVDNLKVGASTDAPTVSASMATALLAYSGIAVKMLVDQRIGAQLANMFMVEYQPGGVALPHDHPLEESYYVLEGETEFVADGNSYVLRPGDVAWAGVGCVHAFYNHSDTDRVRWLETQAPLPPAAQSYRFNRDWDYLENKLDG
jgi:quercetin dioxygenase-like cupin family protein